MIKPKRELNYRRVKEDDEIKNCETCINYVFKKVGQNGKAVGNCKIIGLNEDQKWSVNSKHICDKYIKGEESNSCAKCGSWAEKQTYVSSKSIGDGKKYRITEIRCSKKRKCGYIQILEKVLINPECRFPEEKVKYDNELRNHPEKFKVSEEELNVGTSTEIKKDKKKRQDEVIRGDFRNTYKPEIAGKIKGFREAAKIAIEMGNKEMEIFLDGFNKAVEMIEGAAKKNFE